MLPPGVALQLDDALDAGNKTSPEPEPCAVAGTEYGHGQQVGCVDIQWNDKYRENKDVVNFFFKIYFRAKSDICKEGHTSYLKRDINL